MGTSEFLHPGPVRKTGNPAYPTKLKVLSDPKLLEQHIPLSWLSRKEVAGALSVLLAAGIAGCGGGASVAPVFYHGGRETRGVIGCVAVAPPVFLSEEEALQVVMEELENFGLRMTMTNVELAEVTIPRREVDFEPRLSFRRRFFRPQSDYPVVEIEGSARALESDLKDPLRNVVVEYVSGNEYEDLGGVWSDVYADSREVMKVAEFVSSRVREGASQGIYFGAFYDPMFQPNDMREKSKEIEENVEGEEQEGDQMKQALHQAFGTPIKERNSTETEEDREELRRKTDRESKRILREQVKDFAEWLQAQGVI